MGTTPITYQQACEILTAKYSTMAAAVDRGVFTKLPVFGPEQKLIREQVDLFIGKKQLKISSLSREEYRQWEELEREALQESGVPEVPPFSLTGKLIHYRRSLMQKSPQDTRVHMGYS